MPNWSYNTVVLQGKKEAVHKFIKIGLENSNLQSLNDIDKDWELLCKEGKTKVNAHDINGSNGEVGTIEMETYLSARTFLPMPDTFLLYDTTNCPNAYPTEVVKEQKEKYGAIGWYDYNCLTLGTKWNFKLGENDEPTCCPIDGYEDSYRIVFTCETAWSMPDQWLISINDLVPELFVGIMANEESGAYYCVCYVSDGDLVDYADYTNETDDMWSQFNTNRENKSKEIRADEAKMKELRDEVVSENNNLAENEIEEEIDTKIEEILDNEYGDYVNDTVIFDKLDESFVKMMDEFIS